MNPSPSRHGPTGLVAGVATGATSGKRAVVWEDGVPLDLGTPEGFAVTEAQGVNAFGEVAARVETNPQGYRAYRWAAGEWTDLGLLPGRGEAFTQDINDAGQVVGTSFNLGAGDQGAFLWEDGVLTELETLGSWAQAHAINEAGQVAGSSTLPLPGGGGASRAVLWTDGVVADLGVLPGEDYSESFGLNERGDVAGSSWHVTSSIPLAVNQATLWIDGVPVDLGEVPAPPGQCQTSTGGYPVSVARDVNDCGQVVGHARCIASGAALAAFVWEGGVMRNLNDLVPPDSGWDLLRADRINADGWIVGHGLDPAGELHGFLAIPPPREPLEPSALDLRPAVEPLRVVRTPDRRGLAVTWERLGPGHLHDLHAGVLGEWYSHGALRCGLASASASVEPLPGEDRYFLVTGTTCGAGESSSGRDSFGDERPAAADVGGDVRP